MAGPTTVYRKKTEGPAYEEIVREIKAGHFKPVYYLMGEEGYYIDRLAELLVDALLSPEERDLGLVTMYGMDVDIDSLVTSARAFPMGSRYNVFLIREAQRVEGIERLELYFKQMQPSTVLIFCHKHGCLDRRLKLATLLSKEGVLFESRKVNETQLPSFVTNYLKRKQLAIDPEAALMVAESVGADLSRLVSELDKLALAMKPGERKVTTGCVADHIGFSRQFNVFELQDALGNKDVYKVYQIVKYLDKNPKDRSLQSVLSMLFKFYTNLMLAYYSHDRSEHGLATWLGLQDWQIRKNVLPGMKNYTGVKVMQILAAIRRTDARSKGVDNSSVSNGDLMKELIYFILH